MKKVLLVLMSGIFLTSMVACNSGGGSPPPTESYAYSTGKPYYFEYNLVNLQNVSISGDKTNPVLTCNLSVESPRCSATVKGVIGASGGGYIGASSPETMPIPPIYADDGLNPCPQDPSHPNNVNCTLSFSYNNSDQNNLFMQGAIYSLMSQANIAQVLLNFNLNPLP